MKSAEAFRLLQAGDAARALEAARRAIREHPADAKAHLAEGIALRVLGQLDAARASLERAARCDPRDHAVAYESGVVHQLKGDSTHAFAEFEKARGLKPSFFAAHFSAGALCMDRGEWQAAADRFRTALTLQPGQIDSLKNLARSLVLAGREREAEELYVSALAAAPHDGEVLRAFGRFSVSRGNFRRAATLFAEALRAMPHDDGLPIYLSQVELLEGRWERAWSAYAQRLPRKQLEEVLRRQGVSYRVPPLATLKGADVQLIAEQGFGDILFFLRWAPLLVDAGARLRFVGPPALHSLLQRTGLFASFHDFNARDVPSGIPVMLGDLPQVAAGIDPLTLPSLRIAPAQDRLEAWRARLEAAGPRPWVGLTWRAGLSEAEVGHGLFKTVPLDRLCDEARGLGATAVILQRKPAETEVKSVQRELSPAVDLSSANDHLEDALAVVALLDRYVGVSNTNMHLAACAGATADVLVPFPPEWRWRIAGDSPWFPGFRVHRQEASGSWDAAFASLRASAPAGSTSRG